MNFYNIINSEQLVLVDFYATWCGPCKMMPPILSDLKKRIGDKAKIITIDVDKNPQVAKKFQVQSVPTLIIFKNGKVQWRQAGVVPAKNLERIILENI